MERILLLCTIVMLALCAGCASDPKSKFDPKNTSEFADTGNLSESELKKIEQQQMEQDLFLKSQKDVGLEVLHTRPDTLQVNITNKSAQPLKLLPSQFGIINLPDHKPVPPTPASGRRFPISIIQPGEQASGELVFPAATLRPNSRLVFKNEAVQPAMARVP